MKKNSYILLLAALLSFAFCGCQGDKKKTVSEMEDEYFQKPQMSLSQSDTTEVMAQVERYMSLLQEENYDDALAMLYFLNKDSIQMLPAYMVEQFKEVYPRYHGIKYEIDELIFLNEKDCEAKYTVTLFENKPGDPVRPNKMSFYLKPVRRDGKWYLTMADTMSDTNILNGRGTEIKH